MSYERKKNVISQTVLILILLFSCGFTCQKKYPVAPNETAEPGNSEPSAQSETPAAENSEEPAPATEKTDN